MTIPIYRNQQTHPWLEVNQDCARDVMLIVRLIKKHVLTVATLCRPVLEDALFVYTVFGAEPLPEYGTHYRRSV
jgi:hypothetical protein